MGLCSSTPTLPKAMEVLSTSCERSVFLRILMLSVHRLYLKFADGVLWILYLVG